MSTITELKPHKPQGVSALFFIQIFATLGFAVLYSTLVIYATKKLGFSAKEATAIMGVFGAFNYGLHLFGGYLGGRFMSNRNLFVGGMAFQALGCGMIALGGIEAMYWGLGLFLTGSGLNVTCINMMLTQRFKPEDERREGAFLWNYAGMNLGFFIGFSVAGHFQLNQDYTSLFIFASVGNFIAIVLALLNWRRINDLTTPLMSVSPAVFKQRFVIGALIMLALVPLIYTMLHHAELTGNLVLITSVFIFLVLVALTLKHQDKREQKNMSAYIVLWLGSLVFWTLYQMAPMGLQLFAVNNVDRIVWGVEIAPQWIQNINSVVVTLGGPMMAALFVAMRARGMQVNIPAQFTAALALIGVAFLLLPVGIKLANGNGMVAFKWIFISYVLQSVGELLISPIGYAMIGKLAPAKYQGVMMGTWMLGTGTASVIASFFSGLIPEAKEGSAALTNPTYDHIFSMLGWGSVAIAVMLLVLIPFLRKLISDKQAEPAIAAAA